MLASLPPVLVGLLAAAQSTSDDSSSDSPGLSEVVPEGLGVFEWSRAATVLVIALLIARIASMVLQRLLTRSELDEPAVRFIAHTARNVVVLAGFIFSLTSLGVQLGPLLGALGIGGLAVAFAAQSILENVFASVLLRTRRPFRRGDQVTAADHEGTVQDITFRVVVLRTYDGERVLLPCALVLSNPITNHTVNNARRTTLSVGVAYDTDLDLAQRVLHEAVRRAEDVRQAPEPEVWIEGFGDSSIDLVVRFWHDPDVATLWRVRSHVAREVKRGFDDAGIVIPFPQRTLGFLPADGPLRVASGD